MSKGFTNKRLKLEIGSQTERARSFCWNVASSLSTHLSDSDAIPRECDCRMVPRFGELTACQVRLRGRLLLHFMILCSASVHSRVRELWSASEATLAEVPSDLKPRNQMLTTTNKK